MTGGSDRRRLTSALAMVLVPVLVFGSITLGLRVPRHGRPGDLAALAQPDYSRSVVGRIARLRDSYVADVLGSAVPGPGRPRRPGTGSVGAGGPAWAAAMGGPGVDAASDVAVDRSGNVYTVGVFEKTADFDPGPGVFHLTSAGFGDVFASKVGPAGNLLWARRIGGPSADTASSVAVDRSGNVYMAGGFESTADFDPGPGVFKLQAESRDIFVSKLDANGNLVWARAMGGPRFDVARGVGVDNSGNVYAAGSFEGTADFDPGPQTYRLKAFSEAAFVSKLDPTGEFVWAGAMGGTGYARAWDVALSDGGDLRVVGDFTDNADFDPSPLGTSVLTAAGESGFVAMFDGSGRLLWAGALQGTSLVYPYAVTADGAGNVIAVGVFCGQADFDPSPAAVSLLLAAKNCGPFIVKLDAFGALVWARAHEGDVAYGATTDAAGNVYTMGDFYETGDFDPGPGTFRLTPADRTPYHELDIFVSKLDASGRFVWARALGGSHDGEYTLVFTGDVAIDAASHVVVVGDFLGTADFDPGEGMLAMTSAGSSDAFVVTLDQTR